MSELFHKLLAKRGLSSDAVRSAFLHPKYEELADPLLLPDMKKAIRRLVMAHTKKQKIVVYGDYDIDGLSATTLLQDALTQFGFDVGTFIPNRFDEGYGLSNKAVAALAEHGAQVIITVDCGSSSIDEIKYAKSLGVDVIVTDHHRVGDTLPEAVAIINPHRFHHTYPFTDFAGVGVAFNLVRALQTKLTGLKKGQEKWLLDLVALGTICDIVKLVGENRTLAYWGLKVLHQTKRPGIKALMAVAGIKPAELTARNVGFMLGPRLNAAGRLETAQLSLELLTTQDPNEALGLAQKLNDLNIQRKIQQATIFKAAAKQAADYATDSVLVLSHSDWNHGIVGIVAAKIVERVKKPTFVLQELGDETKGSARSFGEFSVAEAIKISGKHILRGGGHTFAAGVILKTADIINFRRSVNSYYKNLKLSDQKHHLLPNADLALDTFEGVDERLIADMTQLEPYGHGNPVPIFLIENLTVVQIRTMGDEGQHVKLKLQDTTGRHIEFLAFSAPEHFFVETNQRVSVWATFDMNEWNGNRSVEGKLLELTRLQ